MKKYVRYIVLVWLCVLGVALSGVMVQAANKKISYKKNYASTALKVGKTRKVYVVCDGKTVSSSKITWKSSNTKVATIKNGVITAKKYGTTYIYAKLKNSNSNTVKFLLRVYQSKKSVALKSTSAKSFRNPYVLEVGKSKTLKPTIKGKYYRFSSSDTKIVSVSKNGKITAKKTGSATITYITIGKYYCKTTLNVIVGKRIESIDSGVDGSILYMTKGEKYKLNPTVIPRDACYQKYEYETSSKSRATVDSNGVITAKKTGIVYIRMTATDSSGKYDRIKVIITEEKKDVDILCNSTQIVAHRGLSSQAPENTLPAFKLAGKNGFDAIECDVRVTKDGEIVVMHDETLKRMCGIDKKISQMTLEEIKKYPIIAGVNADKYPGNYVPTLDEFIKCCNQYICTPVVEIKGNFSNASLEKVYASIKKSVKPPVVISFYRYNLKWLRKKDASLELQNVAWEASEYELKFCRKIKADMSAQYINLTPDQIKRIQSEGIKVATWTINDKTTFDYFRSIGVDSLSTEIDFM